MPDTDDQLEEKTERLQAAYDEFMQRMRELEHDKLEVMKRVIGKMEQEEIQQLLNDLKSS